MTNCILKQVEACADRQALKNVIGIMADFALMRMDKVSLLNMWKEVQGEIGDAHYNEETAKMHLQIIRQTPRSTGADDYWCPLCGKLTIWDWYVLWGEMERRHGAKIRRWFRNIGQSDYAERINDECLAFLENGGVPFEDLKL